MAMGSIHGLSRWRMRATFMSDLEIQAAKLGIIIEQWSLLAQKSGEGFLGIEYTFMYTNLLLC